MGARRDSWDTKGGEERAATGEAALARPYPAYSEGMRYIHSSIIPLTAITQGWGGPKKLGDEFIEGSFHAHQVPLPNAKKDPEQLGILQEWLESYKPDELFDDDGVPNERILSIIPAVCRKSLQNTEYRLLSVEGWEEDWHEERGIRWLRASAHTRLEAEERGEGLPSKLHGSDRRATIRSDQ